MVTTPPRSAPLSASRIELRRLLDPRDARAAAARPIAGAVNIPLGELAARTHELPPRDALVTVAGPEDPVREAVVWLLRHGRRAAAAASFEWADPGTPAPPGRLWRPSAVLERVLPQLPAGAALELACGTGRDAVYIASCGWRVTAVDALPDALHRARDLHRRYAGLVEPVEWVEADLERGAPPLRGPFDLLVCIRYLHRPLFARFAEWLRPGGHVICETFTTLHRARHGRPASDAHVLRPGELPELLSGFDILEHFEGWSGAEHRARVWARLPGPATCPAQRAAWKFPSRPLSPVGRGQGEGRTLRGCTLPQPPP